MFGSVCLHCCWSSKFKALLLTFTRWLSITLRILDELHLLLPAFAGTSHRWSYHVTFGCQSSHLPWSRTPAHVDHNMIAWQCFDATERLVFQIVCFNSGKSERSLLSLNLVIVEVNSIYSRAKSLDSPNYIFALFNCNFFKGSEYFILLLGYIFESDSYNNHFVKSDFIRLLLFIFTYGWIFSKEKGPYLHLSKGQSTRNIANNLNVSQSGVAKEI